MVVVLFATGWSAQCPGGRGVARVWSVHFVGCVLLVARKGTTRYLAVFGLASLICIGYSVVAFLVRQSFAPSGDDILVWKFTGSPPYAHLTADLIRERLAFIASNREYVYIPMLTLALLAVLQRSVLPLIAVIAVLPWMLWHLIAKDPLAGTFFPIRWHR